MTYWRKTKLNPIKPQTNIQQNIHFVYENEEFLIISVLIAQKIKQAIEGDGELYN